MRAIELDCEVYYLETPERNIYVSVYGSTEGKRAVALANFCADCTIFSAFIRDVYLVKKIDAPFPLQYPTRVSILTTLAYKTMLKSALLRYKRFYTPVADMEDFLFRADLLDWCAEEGEEGITLTKEMPSGTLFTLFVAGKRFQKLMERLRKFYEDFDPEVEATKKVFDLQSAREIEIKLGELILCLEGDHMGTEHDYYDYPCR